MADCCSVKGRWKLEKVIEIRESDRAKATDKASVVHQSVFRLYWLRVLADVENKSSTFEVG
jgi:hypothetical protein